MNATPTTKKVRLKRVAALKRDDVIMPREGLFRRDGVRVKAGEDVIFDGGPWTVTLAELDSSGMFVIELGRAGFSTLIWTPADVFVVLA